MTIIRKRKTVGAVVGMVVGAGVGADEVGSTVDIDCRTCCGGGRERGRGERRGRKGTGARGSGRIRR